jgi:hypothetical protein
MFGKALAIMSAAACASLIVVFMPGFALPVAANTAAVQPAVIANTGAVQARQPSCNDGWPYYAVSCLHDARQPGGRARVVRIVAPDFLASR